MSSSDFSGALWRKSSYSNGQANCVEAAAVPRDGNVAVRDSKASTGAALVFAPVVWRRFIAAVKAERIVT